MIMKNKINKKNYRTFKQTNENIKKIDVKTKV